MKGRGVSDYGILTVITITFTVFLELYLYIDFIDFTFKMATGNC